MTPDPITRLVLELARLPGVGERTAARLAFYILKQSRGEGGPSLAQDLAAALLEVHERIRLCDGCQNFATDTQCRICQDPKRDVRLLCVVEGVADLRAIEDSGAFRGRYHVLHGVLAPLDGVGPELRLDRVLPRVQQDGVEEVVLATNADVEGDATALYLARLLKPAGIRVTRLASGVPLGGELEYIDQATLGRALAERREL